MSCSQLVIQPIYASLRYNYQEMANNCRVEIMEFALHSRSISLSNDGSSR